MTFLSFLLLIVLPRIRLTGQKSHPIDITVFYCSFDTAAGIIGQLPISPKRVGWPPFGYISTGIQTRIGDGPRSAQA